MFVLRDVEGLSTAEVAESLGVSGDVVKQRLSRGRAALRRVLLERIGACAPDAFRFYRFRCDRVVGQVMAQIAGVDLRAGGCAWMHAERRLACQPEPRAQRAFGVKSSHMGDSSSSLS